MFHMLRECLKASQYHKLLRTVVLRYNELLRTQSASLFLVLATAESEWKRD